MSQSGNKATVKAFIRRYGLQRRSKLLYLCNNLPSDSAKVTMPTRPDGWVPDEPSTIWTGLRVGTACSRKQPKAYPTYLDLDIKQRFTYLHWLAGERLANSVPPSYATLYYLGLERKMFGDQYKEAMQEILTLRQLFPQNHLLHLSSGHVLFAAALFQGDLLSLADLVEKGVFDEQESSFREALLYCLIESGVGFCFPSGWLAEWVSRSLRESKPGGEEFRRLHEALFAQHVEKLFTQQPLTERFAAACSSLGEVRALEWRLANKSKVFSHVDRPEFKPIFTHPAFLRDFITAWKACRNEAKLTMKRMALQREEMQLAEAESLPSSSHQFDDQLDAQLAIRSAVSLAEVGREDEARRRLESVLKRSGLGEEDRKSAQAILTRISS